MRRSIANEILYMFRRRVFRCIPVVTGDAAVPPHPFKEATVGPHKLLAYMHRP